MKDQNDNRPLARLTGQRELTAQEYQRQEHNPELKALLSGPLRVSMGLAKGATGRPMTPAEVADFQAKIHDDYVVWLASMGLTEAQVNASHGKQAGKPRRRHWSQVLAPA